MAKHFPTDRLQKRDAAALPAPGGLEGAGSRDEESGLLAGLRQFTRRLATFGLGEAQEPLLTEEIWSIDANGNQR